MSTVINHTKIAVPDTISVVGAREHNLKNVTVNIPKNTLTVITGPSGSGKSSLALDVLFAEGKRRYMESLSSYARQFLGIAKKPEVDSIEGLCPSIAIEQKTIGSNPRSTVGTTTEIYDYLRVLFARLGHIHCPQCHKLVSAQTLESITHAVLGQFNEQQVIVYAPLVSNKKGEFVHELINLFHKGLYKVVIDDQLYKFKSEDEIKALKLGKTYKHTIEILIDTFTVTVSEQARLYEAVEKASELAQGMCKIVTHSGNQLYSLNRMCLDCSVAITELEPRDFSFNSPLGACPECSGLGIIHHWPWKTGDADAWKADHPDFFANKYATTVVCSSCQGKRLHERALAVTIGDKNIHELCSMQIGDLLHFFEQLQLNDDEKVVGNTLIKEIYHRLLFLIDVGLSYLSLGRSARTLSGGEGQRIRLATQIGSALSGVLYVLDEPSIGLHQRDNDRLLRTLKKLRDQGNTVLVVEHDLDTIMQADYIIDMGPRSGIQGGMITATGIPEELARNDHSLTGAYLSRRRVIAVPEVVRQPAGFMTLHNATKYTLKNLTVPFPLQVLCGISGVSGSGKSTLIMQELVPAVEQMLAHKKHPHMQNAQSKLENSESLDYLVVIDQSPIGRTSRSNPATYLGVFDEIRQLFAKLPESNVRGYSVGHFSFNVAQGRCHHCSGDGTVTVAMHFLPEVTTVCSACKGKRYNETVLQIKYKGKTIADVLHMTVQEALLFFSAHKNIVKRLQLLSDVGLEYLALGQPSTTLSGGEAQRIKLVHELAKRGGNTLYVLDEPTTGLHSADIEKLLLVLNKLVDKGNTMIVIEHNLDVLKTVDYIIDLGPEGGDGGGTIIAQGAPEIITKSKISHTGFYLRK